MNTTSEKTLEDRNQRRQSIGTPISGGHGGDLTGKNRRYSIDLATSRKKTEKEGNVVPNVLRASTGSCHDFCKYGKHHEHAKSSIPIKFKRATVVNKEKVTKTVVPVQKKSTIKPSSDLKIQTSFESTKKDVALPIKKPQVLKRVFSTNGKPKEKEIKMAQRSSSMKETGTVKKTGMPSKDLKKVVVKSTQIESKSPKAKASFSKAASFKVIKNKNSKQVSPLKDQNRMKKVELKKTETDSEVKSESMEFDDNYESVPFPSMELIKDPVLGNGLEKESMVNYSVNESSKLFQEKVLEKDFQEKELEKESMVNYSVIESSKLFQENEVLEDSSMGRVLEKSQSFSEVLEEDLLVAPPVSESSQSYYDDEVLEDESEFTDDDEEEEEEDVEESDESVNNEKVNGMENKIPRKGRMVISDKDEEGVKLRFRRGKILDVKSENNGPRRLKFRKGKVLEGNEERRDISRRSFEKKNEKEKDDEFNGHESVVLKHQGEKEKKDAQGLFNNVIEETASKLVETRKSKVKALVGAFETVISLQDGKP